jgi:5'-methylthioadenosine phosphorylase
MSQPFCPEIRTALIDFSEKYTKISEGIYLATEGPRLETKAEIALFSKFAHVVGMTVVPEVVLAKEKGICYASLCLVSNLAAGLQNELPANEIVKIYTEKKETIMKILDGAVKRLPQHKKCDCSEAVHKGKIG